MKIEITKEEIKNLNLDIVKSRIKDLQKIEKAIHNEICTTRLVDSFLSCERSCLNRKNRWYFIGWSPISSINADEIKCIKVIKDDVYVYFNESYFGDNERICLCDQVKVFLFAK